MALLRLDQGDTDAASGTIRRVLGETSEPGVRCDVLAAAVRILLAAGDGDGARLAAEELTLLAADIGAPFLQAIAEHCQGSLAIARGEPAAAVGPLQSCLKTWLGFQAPHEEALTRIELGAAYRALGDHDSARLELDNARTLLVGLGAAPDLTRLDGVADGPVATRGDLSLRELQVLRLLATGETNQSIADALYISVRTVDRHVSNVYTKLGVANRAAATAHAYRHQLI